jgi:hypothetical protein
MIAIINISKERGVAYSRSCLQHYRVQLNQIHLVEFTHMAEEGMSVCLEEAARALDGVDIDEKVAKQELKGLVKQALQRFPDEWGW